MNGNLSPFCISELQTFFPVAVNHMKQWKSTWQIAEVGSSASDR